MVDCETSVRNVNQVNIKAITAMHISTVVKALHSQILNKPLTMRKVKNILGEDALRALFIVRDAKISQKKGEIQGTVHV